MSRGLFVVLTVLTAALLGPRLAVAQSTQVIGNAWQLCDEQAASQERSAGIPRHLLKAISLAETGRWDDQRQENFAWPWTVTSLGKGNYFATKQAALDYVRSLKGRGISNIDVGCMQVNLLYHSDAFASLEDAMDPATNVAYAANFLSNLYNTTGSWTQASGYYHSTTPGRARAYKMKVLKYWNRQRKLASAQDAQDQQDRKAVDRARMAQLNASHKARKAAALNSATGDVRGGQLAAWRSQDSRGLDMATLAAMRRAAKKARWHEQYFGNSNKGKGTAFADKRRKQLKQWRLTRVASND